MRLLTVILISTCSFTAVLSQEASKKVIFGVGLQAVFSDLYDNGITPILTVDVKKHQFYVGPRLTFSRMNHSDYKSYKTRFDHLSEFIIDAGYRYSPLKEHKWLNPNAPPPFFDNSLNQEREAFYKF